MILFHSSFGFNHCVRLLFIIVLIKNPISIPNTNLLLMVQGIGANIRYLYHKNRNSGKNRVSGNTIVSIFGERLFDIMSMKSTYPIEGSKAEAVGILCSIFSVPQVHTPFKREYLEKFFYYVAEGLSSGDLRREHILRNSEEIFSSSLPGSIILIPEYLHAIKCTLSLASKQRNTNEIGTERLHEACYKILTTVYCLPSKFNDFPDSIKVKEVLESTISLFEGEIYFKMVLDIYREDQKSPESFLNLLNPIILGILLEAVNVETSMKNLKIVLLVLRLFSLHECRQKSELASLIMKVLDEKLCLKKWDTQLSLLASDLVSSMSLFIENIEVHGKDRLKKILISLCHLSFDLVKSKIGQEEFRLLCGYLDCVMNWILKLGQDDFWKDCTIEFIRVLCKGISFENKPVENQKTSFIGSLSVNSTLRDTSKFLSNSQSRDIQSSFDISAVLLRYLYDFSRFFQLWPLRSEPNFKNNSFQLYRLRNSRLVQFIPYTKDDQCMMMNVIDMCGSQKWECQFQFRALERTEKRFKRNFFAAKRRKKRALTDIYVFNKQYLDDINLKTSLQPYMTETIRNFSLANLNVEELDFLGYTELRQSLQPFGQSPRMFLSNLSMEDIVLVDVDLEKHSHLGQEFFQLGNTKGLIFLICRLSLLKSIVISSSDIGGDSSPDIDADYFDFARKFGFSSQESSSSLFSEEWNCRYQTEIPFFQSKATQMSITDISEAVQNVDRFSGSRVEEIAMSAMARQHIREFTSKLHMCISWDDKKWDWNLLSFKNDEYPLNVHISPMDDSLGKDLYSVQIAGTPEFITACGFLSNSVIVSKRDVHSFVNFISHVSHRLYQSHVKQDLDP